MGLGSAQDVTLKSARELAAKWRSLAAAEVDPIKQREKECRETLRNGPSFTGSFRFFTFQTFHDLSRLVRMPGSFSSTVSARGETLPLRLDTGDDGDQFPREAPGLVPRAPRWGLGSEEQVRNRIDGMDTFWQKVCIGGRAIAVDINLQRAVEGKALARRRLAMLDVFARKHPGNQARLRQGAATVRSADCRLRRYLHRMMHALLHVTVDVSTRKIVTKPRRALVGTC